MSSLSELRKALGLENIKVKMNPLLVRFVLLDKRWFELYLPKVEVVEGKYDCLRCYDSGVYETGNNDFPCSCPAGDTAVFSDGSTGKQLRQANGGTFLTDFV